MTRILKTSPALGLIAVLAAGLLSTTAHAGEETRAEAAIAEASGKIDAGDKAGVGTAAPDMQRQAREALMSAQDLLTHHKKVEALAAAHHASDLADQAIVVANARKIDADRTRRDDQRSTEAAATQSATMANMRANSAEAATDAANQRADAAERSSAAANAQADAMRNAPPPVVAPTTTTVELTQHDEPAPMSHTPVHHLHHKVVHHAKHPSPVKTTTTATVTTTHN